ncbi:hypothetical protein B0H13DRAFT_2072466, partial [Mycena leptocephala]
MKFQCVTSAIVIGTVDFGMDIIWAARALVLLFTCMGIGECRSLEMSGSLSSATDAPRLFAISAAAPVLVTFIMFVMTVYKCCVTLLGQIHHAMPVWRLFLRDG